MAGRKLADSVAEHRKKSDRAAGVAVITLSMSRSLDTDKSGDVIQELLEENGHQVLVRKVIPDSRSILQGDACASLCGRRKFRRSSPQAAQDWLRWTSR